MSLLKKYFKPVDLKKGDFLVEENIVCNDILWISEGYFQVYVRNENVQAVTDVKALCISYEDMQCLYGHSKSWERLGRIVMENLFVRKQKRVVSFIKHSAEMRYENLLANTPELLQYIPLRILASYLGVKPETLNRIRAKISRLIPSQMFTQTP